MKPFTPPPPAALLALLAAALAAAAPVPAALASAADAPAAYAIEPEFRLLRFGEVMPGGWIREQMARDLQVGFAGHLPEIAPKTAGSGIFTTSRNTPENFHNAGGGSWGGAEGMWWSGETEGNWRSGNVMLSLLSGSPAERAKADARVAEILKSQDPDGYLGIYGPTLRFPAGDVDNGELWTQTTLLRGLIAYYEATGRRDVLAAVEKCVKLTMGHYSGPGSKDPYGAGTMSHNLMFVDVVERLYDLTGNDAYRDFGVYLYRDYSREVKADIALGTLLAQDHPFQGHGATTYEALRVPLWAGYATGDAVLIAAGQEAFEKSWPHVSPTGGPVSDEMIANKPTDPDQGGYEGCGEKEWMTSLLSAAQKTGRARFAEQAETTFYNAAQGSRLPDGSGLDYVTTDNIYRIDGALMDRVVFSPAHEDVADCCAPNFTQLAAIFVRSMWMRSADGLALVLPGPCTVRTMVSDVPVTIEEQTSYPFSEGIELAVHAERPVDFLLRVRVPSWAVGVEAGCAGAQVQRAGDWLLISKRWESADRVTLTFAADVQPVPANNGEFYVRRGPLLYAVPIAAIRRSVKDYPVAGFHDYFFFPVEWAPARFALPRDASGLAPLRAEVVANGKADPKHPWDVSPLRLRVQMQSLDTGKGVPVELVPMGSGEAILRRMTFPAAP
jgi:hypothetical protein